PPISGAATEAAGLIGNTRINRLAAEVDRLHDVVALLAQAIIDTDTHAANVDIDARRLVFVDDRDDPTNGLHGVEVAPFLDLGDGATLAPSDRRCIGAHTSRINADDQRAIRRDDFLARPQDELGGDKAIELRGNKSLS